MLVKVISFLLALAIILGAIWKCQEMMTAERNWIYYGRPEGL